MSEYALEIIGLKKVYDNNVEALKGIDLKITKGDFFALLGPNGAGKSSTIGIISSITNKTDGNIKIFGIDIDKNFHFVFFLFDSPFKLNPFINPKGGDASKEKSLAYTPSGTSVLSENLRLESNHRC